MRDVHYSAIHTLNILWTYASQFQEIGWINNRVRYRIEVGRSTEYRTPCRSLLSRGIWYVATNMPCLLIKPGVVSVHLLHPSFAYDLLVCHMPRMIVSMILRTMCPDQNSCSSSTSGVEWLMLRMLRYNVFLLSFLRKFWIVMYMAPVECTVRLNGWNQSMFKVKR